MNELDDPGRIDEIRLLISRKPALRRFYEEIYGKYADCLSRCPSRGLVVELGSGGGFAKKFLPDLIATDVLPYSGMDGVVDAMRMPFAGASVRLIAMFDVFHHIPDVAAFFREAVRCLVPGGRVLIVDPHPGLISTPVLKYLHHEPYRPDADTWQFDSTGPLSGANSALAWLVFVRDRKRFTEQFSNLKVVRYQAVSPLRYWLSGGLRKWSLLPERGWPLASALDRALVALSPRFGSFVEIEIIRC